MFLVLMTITEAKVYYFYRAWKLSIHLSTWFKNIVYDFENIFLYAGIRLIITLLPASTECMAIFLKITFWKHDSNTFAKGGFIYMHHV